MLQTTKIELKPKDCIFLVKYLGIHTITSTYVDLPDKHRRLTTCGVVYKQNIEKVLSVTQIPTFPVNGIKQIPIMHKISCHIRDMQ